jgi:O-antigen ligase
MLMALSLVMTMSRSGITALALAVIVTGFYMVRADGARSRKLAGATYLIILALTVAGWVGVDTIAQRFSKTNATEFNSRRGAWADTIAVAQSFPAFGTGLNTYGVASLLYQRHNLDKHYEQSHNDYLQLMAEGGVLVTIPAVCCLVLFIREVRRRLREGRGSSSWWIRAGAATALVAIGLQELVDFSLQIPGNTALMAAVCALAIHESASK